MSKLIVYKDFAESRARVNSDRIRANVDMMLHLIEDMPGVGSSLAPESLRRIFGPNIRKALVSPYEIIYEHDPASDVIYVYDLLFGPSIP